MQQMQIEAGRCCNTGAAGLDVGHVSFQNDLQRSGGGRSTKNRRLSGHCLAGRCHQALTFPYVSSKESSRKGLVSGLCQFLPFAAASPLAGGEDTLGNVANGDSGWVLANIGRTKGNTGDLSPLPLLAWDFLHDRSKGRQTGKKSGSRDRSEPQAARFSDRVQMGVVL